MMIDIVNPVVSGALTDTHSTVYFARNYDLKVGAIKDRLQLARPTLFLGVPLVWEKIADKIRAVGAANSGAKKALGDWAKGQAVVNSKSKQIGESLVEPAGFTGAAPIRVDTLEYFGSLGLTINEVYGMSECTGACTISTPICHLWGSCGYEFPGVEVRAFKVDDSDFN